MLFKIVMSMYVLFGGAELLTYIVTGSPIAAASFGCISMCAIALPMTEALTTAHLDRKYGVRR